MIYVVTSILVFFAVALIVVAFGWQSRTAAVEDLKVGRLPGLALRRNRWLYSPLLRPLTFGFNAYNRFLPAPGLKATLHRLLITAGYPGELDVVDFLTVCELVGLLTCFSITGLFFLGAGAVYLTVAVPTLILGTLAPYWWLKDRAHNRTRRIDRELPYGLDLIALAMGAGSTFNEAVRTLVREDPQSPLNQELRQVLGEIEMGRTRTEALLNFGQRIPLEELKSIVSAIIQGETLGTPLTDALRMQSNLLRLKRSVRAEKLAGEAAVKILLPSVLILISVLIMVLGPVIVRAVKGQLY
jgi:tight adherence protein C